MDEALRRIARMEAMGLGRLVLTRLNLNELPPIPPTVRYLYCEFNNLTSLPELPKGLRDFGCTGNKLVSLPILPDSLQGLECDDNEITSLPPLPDGLTKLKCDNNKLVSLPVLPSELMVLSCNNNKIVSLPTLPIYLQILYATHNLLKTLPNIPLQVKIVELQSNPLMEPYMSYVEIFNKKKNPDRYTIDNTILINRFVTAVNNYNESKRRVAAQLKPEIIAARFHPDKIQRNMNKNQVDPEGKFTEEIYNKYYERRGEVWTEGVGTKRGGKRNQKRKTKKRKSSKRKTRKV